MHNISPLETRPERIADVVYNAIRDAIVTKRLVPGERVTEAGLAARLKVSKTPVREAMLRLQEVGLIEPDAVRGTRVLQPSATAFEHAFELREALETFTARKAAMQATQRDIRTIRETAQRSLNHARAGRIDDFRSCDRELHEAIAAAAGNPRIAKAIDDAVALIGALRARDLPHAEAAATCAESHVAIAEAIRAHDADSAEERMRAHLRELREFTVLHAEPA